MDRRCIFGGICSPFLTVDYPTNLLGGFQFILFFFLAGEMLSVAEHFLEQQMHPTVIIWAYRKALDDMISILKKIG